MSWEGQGRVRVVARTGTGRTLGGQLHPTGAVGFVADSFQQVGSKLDLAVMMTVQKSGCPSRKFHKALAIFMRILTIYCQVKKKKDCISLAQFCKKKYTGTCGQRKNTRTLGYLGFGALKNRLTEISQEKWLVARKVPHKDTGNAENMRLRSFWVQAGLSPCHGGLRSVL